MGRVRTFVSFVEEEEDDDTDSAMERLRHRVEAWAKACSATIVFRDFATLGSAQGVSAVVIYHPPQAVPA